MIGIHVVEPKRSFRDGSFVFIRGNEYYASTTKDGSGVIVKSENGEWWNAPLGGRKRLNGVNLGVTPLEELFYGLHYIVVANRKVYRRLTSLPFKSWEFRNCMANDGGSTAYYLDSSIEIPTREHLERGDVVNKYKAPISYFSIEFLD